MNSPLRACLVSAGGTAVASFLLAGCQLLSSASPESERERLAAFFETSFEQRLARSPMFQTRLGIKTNYDKWDDLSDEFKNETVALRRRELERLRTEFAFESLHPRDQLSYRLFEYAAERQLASHEWRFHSYPVNQMFGLHAEVPAFLINQHRVETTEDLAAYITRLRGIESLFDQLVVGLEKRAELGVRPPQFVFPMVLDDCRNVLRGSPFDGSGSPSPIFADVTKKIAALEFDEAEQEEWTDRARGALVESVGPAYERLIGVLEREQALATTDDGVWKLPRGAEYYEHRLAGATTLEIGAERVHEIGLQEVRRIHDEMRAIMKRVEFEGKLKDFFRYTREDERFYFSNDAAGRQAYLDLAQRYIDGIAERLDELFVTKPTAALVVKPVEAYREKSAGKAFYETGSPDGKRPGVYYANLYAMSEMPIYQAEALAYHEAIPGHHMQLSIAQEQETLPRFRRYGGYTAYVEGWALYTELVPKEMGFYEDPYSDFGRLAMELWRACRLVVDTGIHEFKWTRGRAIDYLLENTPNPKGDCVKAIERYIVMPGQATAYKIGMLEIQKLRREAEAALGEAFDLRAFHDLVLTTGPVPLEILGDVVREWIAKSKPMTPGT